MSVRESRRRLLVVAALIVDGPRVLITQRRADQALGLQWEFPGGKLEPGEAPAAALRRELAEEIGVEVEVGAIWDVLHHAYPDFDLLMLVYPCRLGGEDRPTCRDVADLAWAEPEALEGFEFLPADRPLIDRLRREGLPVHLLD